MCIVIMCRFFFSFLLKQLTPRVTRTDTRFPSTTLFRSRLGDVASGTIVVPPALPLPERPKVILDNLRQVARDTRPDVAALEIVFLNANPDRKSTRLTSSH